MTKPFHAPFTRCNVVLLSFVLPLLFSSCMDRSAPDFPYEKIHTVSTTTKSFEYIDLDTITWDEMKLPKYSELPMQKIKWDQLKSSRVKVGFPYEGSSDISTTAVNFEELPYIPFDIDSFPSETFSVRTIALGEPESLEAGPLTVPPRGTRGLRSLEEPFGLPNEVSAATMAEDGSMWIGGVGGFLARYDSSQLMIYGPDQGLDLGSDALCVAFDPKGLVWMSSNSGRILAINVKAGLVHEISSPLLDHQIFELSFMKDGTVWFRNNQPGYTILDLSDQTLRVMGGPQGPFTGFPIVSKEDHQGLVWMSTMGGIRILDRAAKRLYSLTSQQGLSHDQVYNFFEDDQKRMWIGTSSGVDILDAERKSLRFIGAEHGLKGVQEVFSMHQANSGKFWFGSGNGRLVAYDEQNNTFETYDSTVDNGILFDILEDPQGQIWATNVRRGMYMVDQTTGQPANLDTDDGLEFDRVWSTQVDNSGRIWLGTEQGVAVYNPVTEVAKFITHNEGLAADYTYNLRMDSQGRFWTSGSIRGVSVIDPEKGEIRKIEAESELNGMGVANILEWNQGFIMGDFDGRMLWYDPESNASKMMIDSLFTDRVTDLATDASNNLYVGTQGSGIWILDPSTGARKQLSTANALVSDDIMSLRFDPEGKLWVAGLKGVQRIDLDKREISLFTKDQGLSANDVYDLALKDGKVFTGDSRGISVLEQYDPEQDKWKVYSLGKDQGMVEIDISQNSFSFDSEGHLWAGANARALVVADPVETDTLSHPVSISGLNLMGQNTQYFDPVYRQEAWAAQDSIWMWKSTGFSLLSEKERDSLEGNNVRMNFSRIEESSGMPLDLELSHDQNYMSFDFNGGQFKNSEAMVYSYILEGIDKDWSKITSETRSENYRDLPPGTYTFKVAGKGFNDVWSRPTAFSFRILPPWWKTRWAYVIYFILISSSAYGFMQYRSRWLKRENRLLEERVNHRTAQLKKTIEELETTQGQLIQSEKMASLGELTAGIAHEIQNPMNFINNFSEVSNELIDEMIEEMDKGELEEAREISSDIKQNLEKISHHGHRASSIVRGMLEHSRNSSGQKEDIDINVLADEYLRLAYHGLRAKDKSFNAKFETEFDDSIGKIEIVPQDIGRVMLNLINNAFYAVSDRNDKGEEGYQPLVKVTTKKQKGQVRITVEDNGSGIPQDIQDKIFQPFFTTKPSGKGTGLGLSLTYDIITQGHGGALELDSDVGKGTVFTIYLPVRD